MVSASEVLKPGPNGDLTLTEMFAGGASLSEVVEASLARAAKGDRHEWIFRLPEADVKKQVAELESRAEGMDAATKSAELPLLGTTFAVKDNVAVAGYPMTNGCDYRSGGAPVPAETAAAVRRLMEKGAVLIGKTNLDCAATGLVGVRSAYGACQNSIDRKYVSGGSSSGSSVAVATGQVTFSLGTDTAGSGRVPAMFNNIVGLKASRGLVSCHGVVPACRTLDCLTIFALTVREAQAVLQAAVGPDGTDDPYDRAPRELPSGPRLPPSGPAKFTFGIPGKAHLDFSSFGDVGPRAAAYAGAWQKSIEALEAAGGTCVEVDYTPFWDAAKLLYGGPWVAERASALREILESNPEVVHPTVRKIVEPAGGLGAIEAFVAAYKLRELKAKSVAAMKKAGAQLLVTPTAGMIYTIQELEADPIALNTNLGRYTNHMNLLDLCGIAVPTVFADGGLPFGVTISAPAGQDGMICDVAHRVHMASGLLAGALPSKAADVQAAVDCAGRVGGAMLAGVDTIEVAVSGAHMIGLPLSWQLTERGGRFLRRAKTAPVYKLLAFTGMKPPRPGLAAAEGGNGASVELEIWELPAEHFGSFMKVIAAPLGIGWLQLDDGSKVQGFRLVDTFADCAGAAGGAPPVDITSFGGWRSYLESQGAGEPATKKARTE